MSDRTCGNIDGKGTACEHLDSDDCPRRQKGWLGTVASAPACPPVAALLECRMDAEATHTLLEECRRERDELDALHVRNLIQGVVAAATFRRATGCVSALVHSCGRPPAYEEMVGEWADARVLALNDALAGAVTDNFALVQCLDAVLVRNLGNALRQAVTMAQVMAMLEAGRGEGSGEYVAERVDSLWGPVGGAYSLATWRSPAQGGVRPCGMLVSGIFGSGKALAAAIRGVADHIERDWE